MGQAIQQAAGDTAGICASRVWKRGESLDAVVAAVDVLIDFSLPDATAEVLAAVQKHRKPLVCGVSGLNAEQMTAIERAAMEIPVVYDRNMSQGVAVLADLVKRAASSLGSEFDVEVHEVHHVHKVDAPSGTALKLGEAIESVRAVGGDGVRYAVERRGEVPGEHTVTFASPTETLSLKHSVTNRQVFAAGAIRAAQWITRQPAGLYQMRDVLFGEINRKKTPG